MASEFILVCAFLPRLAFCYCFGDTGLTMLELNCLLSCYSYKPLVLGCALGNQRHLSVKYLKFSSFLMIYSITFLLSLTWLWCKICDVFVQDFQYPSCLLWCCKNRGAEVRKVTTNNRTAIAWSLKSRTWMFIYLLKGMSYNLWTDSKLWWTFLVPLKSTIKPMRENIISPF